MFFVNAIKSITYLFMPPTLILPYAQKTRIPISFQHLKVNLKRENFRKKRKATTSLQE